MSHPNLWLEIVQNWTGTDHAPILYECDTHDEMNAFLEAQRAKLEKRFKMPVMLSHFNDRFSFMGLQPQQHKRDAGRMLLILRLHGSSPFSSMSKIQMGTREENLIQGHIAELVGWLQSTGIDHLSIPSIFANAAYQQLVDNGSIRLDTELYTRGETNHESA